MEEKIIEARFTKNSLAIIMILVSTIMIVLGLGNAWYIYKNVPIGGSGSVFYYEVVDSFGEFCIEATTQLGSTRYEDNAALILRIFLIYLGIAGILVALILFWEMSRCVLTVTNRRVTGRASFGKAVDLPLNQISAIGLGFCSRITVATSSGKIHFWFVENRNEVHSALTDIVGKVQVESAYTQSNNSAPSDADELKKYKDLLDAGIITQEEFDAKKKQLLGL